MNIFFFFLLQILSKQTSARWKRVAPSASEGASLSHISMSEFNNCFVRCERRLLSMTEDALSQIHGLTQQTPNETLLTRFAFLFPVDTIRCSGSSLLQLCFGFPGLLRV